VASRQRAAGAASASAAGKRPGKLVHRRRDGLQAAPQRGQQQVQAGGELRPEQQLLQPARRLCCQRLHLCGQPVLLCAAQEGVQVEGEGAWRGALLLEAPLLLLALLCCRGRRLRGATAGAWSSAPPTGMVRCGMQPRLQAGLQLPSAPSAAPRSRPGPALSSWSRASLPCGCVTQPRRQRRRARTCRQPSAPPVSSSPVTWTAARLPPPPPPPSTPPSSRSRSAPAKSRCRRVGRRCWQAWRARAGARGRCQPAPQGPRGTGLGLGRAEASGGRARAGTGPAQGLRLLAAAMHTHPLRPPNPPPAHPAGPSGPAARRTARAGGA
jgi:hypothetical protein